MGAEKIPFYRMPDAPTGMSAGAMLGRLTDSIGFRFRWAAEGLGDADLAFKPAPDCMTQAELILHIHDLLVSAGRNAGMPEEDPIPESASCSLMCARVLDLCVRLSARYKSMSERDLARCSPQLWNMVNGPLADCLTHIGQMLSWRRLAGAPPAPADLFRGLPPAGA